MSEVIQFLAAAGRNPGISPAAYAAAVAGLSIDAQQRDALLNRDQAALTRLLGGRDEIRCLILTPDLKSVPDVASD